MAPLPQEELRRTARQMNLPGFGAAEQEKLHDTKVLVIGAGGLGCPVMQALAAAGVGHISVVDDDTVSVSNIHRQILFGAPDVGRVKVDVVAERLAALQPGIEVRAIRDRFTSANAVELMSGMDLIIDGSDTFATKFLAADAAEITGVPLVWGTVLRYRGDVALWWSGPGAPDDGVGLRDLFPTQPDPDSVPDCATAGVLGVTTSVVGGLMATETIAFIAGLHPVQPGRLITYDALEASVRHFTVRHDPARELATAFGDYPISACAVDPTGQRLVAEIARGEAIGLDVREPHEKAVIDIVGAQYHLPTSVWDEDPSAAKELLSRLPEGADVVVYCASGVRSGKFVDKFSADAARRGIRLRSLPSGANAYGVEPEA